MHRISKVLTVFFIISAIGISLSHAESIWEKRQKALKGIEEKQEEAVIEETQAENAAEPTETEKATASNSPIPLDDIFVPDQYGSITETHEGTNGKLIVHIQDAHANYEAQKNIAAIIGVLIDNHNMNLVLMEGKLTNRDFKYLRYRASQDVRIEIADKLLKSGEFNAVNYLDMSSSYPIELQGVEDKNLYDVNSAALLEMDKFKDVAMGYLDKIAAVAEEFKIKIYTGDLLELDKAKKDYENESIDLLTYYKKLYDVAQKNTIGTKEFPNFANLMKINEMEQKIDLVKIRSGKTADEQKNLYAEYQGALKKLNVSKLFKEEALVENKIQKAVTENTDQQKLYKISKAVLILDKMLKIKLVPEEYSYFLENKKDFDPKSWVDFLKQKSEEFNIDLDIPDNFYVISENLATVEKFYATAMEREKTFIKKSEDKMDKDNVKSAILITGGFHTSTLTQSLNDMGYSYIVISPKVTTKTDDELYRQTLKREWAAGIK